MLAAGASTEYSSSTRKLDVASRQNDASANQSPTPESLASFCLLATSSFLVLELYSVFAPGASTRLAALRTWLDQHGTQVLIAVCLVVGLWLAGQSGYLLATGQR